MANPLAYVAEGRREAWSRLPGTKAYDARNPSSPYYGESKGPGGYTPSEAMDLGLTDRVAQGVSFPFPGGGQVQGASTTVDPYGGQYANLVNQFNTGQSAIGTGARNAAQNTALTRKSSILDFLESLRAGQGELDERGIQNELARKQGMSSILDMVGNGIRSGNVTLSNRNASDSSAALALAQAYGRLGQRQLGQVGNQYEVENRNLGRLQDTFNTQRASNLRHFDEDKQLKINQIVGEAESKIADLNSWAAGKSLPQRLQAEQEIARIRAEAEGILTQFDTELGGANTIGPSSVEDRRRSAFGLANAGVTVENPFNFTTEAPLQFQNTGPASSGLPIFTLPRRRQEF